MPTTVNLASKYAPKVDERFKLASKANITVNNDYDWDGVDTVNVYSVDTAPLNNYNAAGGPGVDRYGECNELGNKVQKMQLMLDKSWTFSIDKKNRKMTQMVMDAGKAAARQIDEVLIPFRDTYIFAKEAAAACATEGHWTIDSTPIKPGVGNKAYERFLTAREALGNDLAPDEGLVCISSYGFAKNLMLDNSFVRYGNLSQEMINKGLLGTADGVKIVRVPATRLPKGCNFILVHPLATVAPQILTEYKIHTDPPGISGWKVEGRWLFDAFVLNNKKNALYYDGEFSVEEPDPLTFTNAKNMAELNKMLQNSAGADSTSTQKASTTSTTKSK